MSLPCGQRKSFSPTEELALPVRLFPEGPPLGHSRRTVLMTGSVSCLEGAQALPWAITAAAPPPPHLQATCGVQLCPSSLLSQRPPIFHVPFFQGDSYPCSELACV